MATTPAPVPGGDEERTGRGWTRPAVLVAVGIVLLSLNLRPAAVSVGPVISEVVDGLGMSLQVAGLLTSLPPLAFAVFGAVAPWAARTMGLHRVTLLTLVLVAAGLVGRALVDGPEGFLLLSLVALAGMAAGNVLLPALVKLHFPRRVGLMTGVYTTAMAIGLTASLTLTVPLAEVTGGWRGGLGAWAVLAVLGAVPWLGLIAHDRHLGASRRPISLGQVARTPLGWAMALFFALQSAQAYAIFGWFAQLWRDAGWSPVIAGALVGLLAGIGIPLSLFTPWAAARRPDQRLVLVAVMSCYPVGYLGLLLEPHSLAPLWAVLLGIGCCTFPLALVMIGLRARTSVGTAALSGFTQSVGYLLAVAGPWGVGALYGATGGWTAPLLLLLVINVPQLFLGLYCARPLFIEDQLDHLNVGASN